MKYFVFSQSMLVLAGLTADRTVKNKPIRGFADESLLSDWTRAGYLTAVLQVYGPIGATTLTTQLYFTDTTQMETHALETISKSNDR